MRLKACAAYTGLFDTRDDDSPILISPAGDYLISVFSSLQRGRYIPLLYQIKHLLRESTRGNYLFMAKAIYTREKEDEATETIYFLSLNR